VNCIAAVRSDIQKKIVGSARQQGNCLEVFLMRFIQQTPQVPLNLEAVILHRGKIYLGGPEDFGNTVVHKRFGLLIGFYRAGAQGKLSKKIIPMDERFNLNRQRDWSSGALYSESIDILTIK
jgi:hypothetical protein